MKPIEVSGVGSFIDIYGGKKDMGIKDINATTADANITASMMFELLPYILIISAFVWLYHKLFGIPYDVDVVDSDVPEEILKQRFARGEIDVYEYTERMARL